MEVIDYITNTVQPYLTLVPYAGAAFLSSFLFTPIVGFIAEKLGIVDLPAKLRKRSDKSIKTRIREEKIVRAGGLAVIIPSLIIIMANVNLDKQMVAMCLGVVVLTIAGVIDDKFEISSKWQILAHLAVALIVVASGTSIDLIQSPFDTAIDFRWFVLPLDIGGSGYSIALPADLITIAWILIVINVINWVFGIDQLGEGISVIAFLTILFVGIKYSNFSTAFVAAVLAGAILGFMPFNLSPSKVISGTAGNTVYGFLIAVLSVLGGVKVSTSIIVLAIPLIDMVWVMIGRVHRAGATNIAEAFKSTTIGDDTHLHHRLLKLGLSVSQITIVEWTAVVFCAVLAFATARLSKLATISIVCTGILILFFIISIFLKKRIRWRRKKLKKDRAKKPETPDERYAY